MRTTPFSRASILIVDDVRPIWKPLQPVFKGARRLFFATDAAQAFAYFQSRPVHLVCLGVSLPDLHGIELLKKLKQAAPDKPVIMASADRDIKTAVDAMKAGALDFMTAPFDAAHVRTLAAQALARRSAHSHMKTGRRAQSRAGRDDAMHSARQIIDALSPIDCHVLILGGAGILKNRIARLVHERSRRAQGPYVTINCAKMPARSLESALFGQRRRGAGNPALEAPGKIEGAHTGSLFLDNVNYLSPGLQARLLPFIQHQAFEAVKSRRQIKTDVRIIAASSQSLQAFVEAGLFLRDLYSSLSALPIDLPLLQARGEHIGLLLEHFFRRHAIRDGLRRKHFSTLAKSTLMACDWPGHAREFERLLERLCNIHELSPPSNADPPESPRPDAPFRFQGLGLKKATRAFERQHIIAALKAFDGNRSRTARHLGIHRNTLLTKTKELGIDFG